VISSDVQHTWQVGDTVGLALENHGVSVVGI